MAKIGKYYLCNGQVRVNPLYLDNKPVWSDQHLYVVVWLSDGYENREETTSVYDFMLFSVVTSSDFTNFRIASQGSKSLVLALGGAVYELCTAEPEITAVNMRNLAENIQKQQYDRVIIGRMKR